MMQSKDTKMLNPDQDFDEVMNKVKQARWDEKKTKIRNRHSFVLTVAGGKHGELCGRMVLP